MAIWEVKQWGEDLGCVCVCVSSKHMTINKHFEKGIWRKLLLSRAAWGEHHSEAWPLAAGPLTPVPPSRGRGCWLAPETPFPAALVSEMQNCMALGVARNLV